MNEDSSLRIACDRFDRSHYEANVQDKLLDLWIGLEALYSGIVTNQPNMSIRKKIASTSSMILGRNDRERQELEDHINACYELRSRLVHGGSVEAVSIIEKVSKLEEILRKSILQIIHKIVINK